MILEQFLGIPYVRRGSSREGADCWGLVPLVYRELRGIEIPLYNGQGRPSQSFVRDCIEEEQKRAWEPIDERRAQFMDVVVLRSTEIHIGIVDEDPRYILTTSYTMVTSKKDEWGRGTRWDGRVIGVYRYVG